MDLFIQPNVAFEKQAAQMELPEDPNTWPKEILDELYRQVPYIADFRPHVVMSKVDPERMYGLGHVEISNESEAQMGTDPNMMQAAGVRSVRIPIVIRDGKLSPFDLLVNDRAKVMPLTETRLRQAIFRPQAFDVTSQTPGDQSMIGQLYPPYRQNFGFGGGGVSIPAMGMGKTGSVLEEMLIADLESKDAGFRKPKEKTAAKPVVEFKKTASMLQSILPTIGKQELDGFWSNIESDMGLRAQFRKNAQASSLLLGLLAQHEPVTSEKMASVLPNLIKPSVVQIVRGGDGYMVKAASHHYWKPFVQHVDRGELIRRFGEKVAYAVDSAGAVTMADGAEAAEAPPENKSAPILEPGLYKVCAEDGSELVGYVITNLIDTDGGPLPLSLFTDGSHSTVQSEIHGEPAGEGGGQTLPSGPVSGMGAFFEAGQEGIRATVPMSLGGSFQEGEEPTTFVGETFDGRPVEVSVQPNIQQPMGTGDGKLLIPQHWQWLPLDKTQSVALVGSEESFGDPDAEKPAPDPSKQASACVEIRSSGETFSFRGRPVEKLAYAEREMLDLDSAMFLLAGLGVEQGYGVTKLSHAMTGAHPELVKVGRTLTTAEEANREAFDAAVEKLSHVPDLRQDLVKEASVIPDPMAVDTVLSLGFINPENLMTFVSYLPTLDDAQMKMCELLLAVRLGLMNVPESALERAVRSTEEAIEGLKIIAFSE